MQVPSPSPGIHCFRKCHHHDRQLNRLVAAESASEFRATMSCLLLSSLFQRITVVKMSEGVGLSAGGGWLVLAWFMSIGWWGLGWGFNTTAFVGGVEAQTCAKITCRRLIPRKTFCDLFTVSDSVPDLQGKTPFKANISTVKWDLFPHQSTKEKNSLVLR